MGETYFGENNISLGSAALEEAQEAGANTLMLRNVYSYGELSKESMKPHHVIPPATVKETLCQPF